MRNGWTRSTCAARGVLAQGRVAGCVCDHAVWRAAEHKSARIVFFLRVDPNSLDSETGLGSELVGTSIKSPIFREGCHPNCRVWLITQHTNRTLT